MKLLLAAAALGLLLLSPRLALACGCLGTTTVCKSYAGAEAVFVGSVTRVSNKTAKDEDGNEHIVSQVAKVQVEEAFKGAKEPELTFRSYGTSCDVTYKEGQYAHFRDLPNCPQIDKLVKAYKDIETKRIKLELNRDHQDIELLFTVPFCAKKKEERE